MFIRMELIVLVRRADHPDPLAGTIDPDQLALRRRR
jgi:hypothetical protein